MMEQALQTMQSLSDSSGDALSMQSVNFLRRLLEIQKRNNIYLSEDDAYYSVQQAQQPDSQPISAVASASVVEEEGERLYVPYFGVMRVLRRLLAEKPAVRAVRHPRQRWPWQLGRWDMVAQ